MTEEERAELFADYCLIDRALEHHMKSLELTLGEATEGTDQHALLTSHLKRATRLRQENEARRFDVRPPRNSH